MNSGQLPPRKIQVNPSAEFWIQANSLKIKVNS